MQKYDQILTCKAWIVMSYENGAYLRGNNWDRRLQMASLTKMYTLYACLKLNKQINIAPDKMYVKIFQIMHNGTQANLSIGEYIKIEDLYYGMILPSGNDAATLLAYYYGYWIDKSCTFPKMIFTKYKKFDYEDKKKHENLFIKKFMHFINDSVIKKQLKHTVTRLENPHGMSQKFHLSNAWQLAEAAIHFRKSFKEFRLITKTKKYSSYYLDKSSTDQQIIQGDYFEWQNTNILLKQAGYEGIKTGQTPSAGCCLATFKKTTIRYDDYQFVVIVLGCQTPQQRFTQTKLILDDLEKYYEELKYKR